MRIVAALDIGSQITGKIDRLAAHLKHRAVAFDRDRGAPALGVGHLAGDGALPNHVEQAKLILVQLIAQLLGQRELMAGGANRLVCFLGVLDLGLINPCFFRQKVAAVLRLDQRRAARMASCDRFVESVRM